MKETLAGLVVAALFVAALWFGLPLLSKTGSQSGAPGLAAVDAGFVGQKRFGPWILTCPPPSGGAQTNGAPTISLLSGHGSPLPPPPGAQAEGAGAGENALGRCRAVHPYMNPKDQKQVVMIASFRTVGAAKALAFVVRFPDWAKKGDDVVLKLDKSGFKFPVAQCEKSVCIAIAPLNSAAELQLLSSKDAAVVFPPGTDGKRKGARLPLIGLRAALANMRKAES